MVVSLINACSDEQFALLVKESFSIKEIEGKLGYNSYSGSISDKIMQRIKSLNLDISHFNSQSSTVRSEKNIFVKDSTAT